MGKRDLETGMETDAEAEEEAMNDIVMFQATIPQLQSAINIPGDERDAPRIKLDVDPNDLPAVLRLSLMRGKVLRVTVEVVHGAGHSAQSRDESNGVGRAEVGTVASEYR